MKNEHVLGGLLAKRAELAGRIEFGQHELRQMMIDLDALDATIRLFNPEINLVQIKPKPLPARNQHFGERSRALPWERCERRRAHCRLVKSRCTSWQHGA